MGLMKIYISLLVVVLHVEYALSTDCLMKQKVFSEVGEQVTFFSQATIEYIHSVMMLGFKFRHVQSNTTLLEMSFQYRVLDIYEKSENMRLTIITGNMHSRFSDPGHIVIVMQNMQERDAGSYTLDRNSVDGPEGVLCWTLYISVPEVTLTPNTSVYVAAVGDDIPEVSCHALCYPSCNVTWISDKTGNVFNGTVLNLGVATAEMSGEYTCLARKDGIQTNTQRTIYLQVNERSHGNDYMVIVLIAQGCLVVVLTAALVATTLLLCRRKKAHVNDTSYLTPIMHGNTGGGQSVAVVMETYTDLSAERREIPTESVYDPLEGDSCADQSDYENTEVWRPVRNA